MREKEEDIPRSQSWSLAKYKARTRSAPRTPVISTEIVAALSAGAAAVWFHVAQGVTISLLVSIAMFPVWWPVLRDYLLARTVIVVGIAAAVSGVSLGFVEMSRAVSISVMQGQTLDFISFVGSIGLLLWSRSRIGIGATAIWFGVGSLVDSVLKGLNAENPWKFSLAIPVALIFLGVAAYSKKRWLEAVALIALATTSALSDSRSMTAFFVLVIPVVGWQALRSRGEKRSNPLGILLWLCALSIAAYNLFQSMLLDGVLGEGAQLRTQAQIESSGSLILGGRPEIGASVALIADRPIGYGAGVLPSSSDIWVAKTGMSALGYDPNNGYVERYMFGSQFEVHSVLGDFWLRFGPIGAALALLLLGISAYGVAHQMARREVSAVAVYMFFLGAWNVFFSPALPSFPTLALMLALTVNFVGGSDREIKFRRNSPRECQERCGANGWDLESIQSQRR